jgi:hypothetical protein
LELEGSQQGSAELVQQLRSEVQQKDAAIKVCLLDANYWSL